MEQKPNPGTQSLGADLAKAHAAKASPSYNLKRLGNYSIIKKIGEGGMGAVFLAEDVIAQRIVALKVLPPDKVGHPNAVARFQREAKAIGRLNHPNIIQAYALGEENGFHFYAMERCDGKPLDAILDKKKRLSCERALGYITQAARGLEHAHAHDIIHRDIKPGNLFITGDGVVKILDLGLSKDIAEDHENSFLTGCGTVLGTPYYISPEQGMGKTDVDGRADIYSLGATLYHLVTGRTPFSGSNPAVIVSKHLIEKLPNPQDITPGIPDGVVQVIMRMMAKSPDDRYQDCSELLEDLEALAAGEMPAAAEIAQELTSILPRSGILAATDAPEVQDDGAGALSLSDKLNGVPFGAKVVGVCAVFALLMLFFVVRAMRSNSSSEPAVAATPVNEPPAESASPQWSRMELPPPLPPELPKTPPAVAPAPVPAPVPEPPVARTPEVPVAVVPLRPQPELTKDKAGFKDVLPLVDPQKSVHGVWKFVNGALTSDPGNFARISVAYELPQDYDMKIDFGSVGGEFAVMLPCHDKGVVLMISAIAHACLLGSPADHRPRWTPLGTFDFSKRHTATVEVRNDSAKLFMDDFRDALLEWKFERAVTPSPEFPWRMADTKKLGLGANRAGTTIYSLNIRDASAK